MKTVCVSGYFDTINISDIEYCKNVKVNTGAEHLIVIINNDEESNERMNILKEFWFINQVIISIDMDGTVCKTLESIYPKPDYYFYNREATTEMTNWQRIWNGVEYLLYNHI